MTLSRFFVKLDSLWQEFTGAKSGNVAVIFAVLAVPLLASVGAAVDTSRALSVRTALQSALDSTALNMMKQASSMSSSDLSSTAQSMFLANFNRPDAMNTQVAALYSISDKTLTLTGSASVPTAFMKIIGFPQVTVDSASTAKLGMQRLPVCVFVTNPDSNHTFLVKNQATVNFTNCLVQVNTQNWDAVEARDTSYIHSANGVNCFTGDIHYGDVKPPKLVTCDLLPDPFASYNVPTNACSFTNKVVTATATLSPGTYCGGINITGGNATFSPGLYFIQDGDLKITGSSNVTANGVTFLISGSNSNIDINTSGNITMSPAIDASAGQWAGFQFYYDQPAAVNNKNSAKAGKNTIAKATMNISGVVYLAGQTLNITNNANVTVNPGAIVADFILPDSANLTLSSMLASTNPALFSKTVPGTSPVLVK